MTDRELLELAAKASGFTVSEDGQAHRDRAVGRENASLWIDGVTTSWNPLRKRSDALRLATDMDMVISINRVDGYTEASCGYSNTDIVSLNVKHEKDMHAATRRAIVRAAAEIGRAKP